MGGPAGIVLCHSLRRQANGAGPTAARSASCVSGAEGRSIYGEWIGTLTGQVNADIKAQVTGYVLTQNYKEGSYVRTGQLLFETDPRPFQAALDQAKGQMAQAEAPSAARREDHGTTGEDGLWL